MLVYSHPAVEPLGRYGYILKNINKKTRILDKRFRALSTLFRDYRNTRHTHSQPKACACWTVAWLDRSGPLRVQPDPSQKAGRRRVFFFLITILPQSSPETRRELCRVSSNQARSRARWREDTCSNQRNPGSRKVNWKRMSFRARCHGRFKI